MTADASHGAEAPPELVQLLTPEGERVEHPDYDIDLTPEEIRGLYRDLVLVRRVDAEAVALQRQGELGIWASLLGQEAAQIGSGRALTDADMAFPTYREHGVAWCRGVDPVNLLGLFRGVNHGGWDPARAQLPPVHDRHRQPDPARHRLRHGHPARRRRRRGDRLLRRRRHLPGRRERVVHLGVACSTRRSCSSARTTSGPSPSRWRSSPASRCTGGPSGFGFPGVRVDGNDVFAVPRRDPQGAGRRQRRAGPDAHRGVHLPHGRPHHLRRPDPLPGGRPSWRRGSSRTRSSGSRPTWSRTRSPTRSSSTRSTPRPTTWAPTCASAAWRCPTPSRWPSSTTSTRSRTRCRRGARTSSRAYLEGFEDDDHPDAGQGAQRGPAQGHGGRPQGPRHGRGRRQARRRVPGHRRAAEGLRRGAGHRHPAGRVGHRRHRHRPGAARLPAGVRDPVRRLRLPRVRPDHHPARQDAAALARQAQAAGRRPHPVRRRHRRGRAPQRVARGLLHPHRAACAWSPAPTPPTRTG